jgi:hypothetical protein
MRPCDDGVCSRATCWPASGFGAGLSWGGGPAALERSAALRRARLTSCRPVQQAATVHGQCLGVSRPGIPKAGHGRCACLPLAGAASGLPQPQSCWAATCWRSAAAKASGELSDLNDTRNTQPALFVLESLLVDGLREQGRSPSAGGRSQRRGAGGPVRRRRVRRRHRPGS